MKDKNNVCESKDYAPTVGKINFSNPVLVAPTMLGLPTLNNILPREVLLEIVKRHEKVSDFYHAGPVQKASIESFVDNIIEYLMRK